MSTNHQVFLFLVEENGKKVLMEANGIGGQPTLGYITEAAREDSIEWRLGNNSGIVSINRIYSNEDILFSNQPTGELNVWGAVINPNAPLSLPNSPYSYFVEVLPIGNVASILTCDPKIQVIPSSNPSPVV